MSKASAAAAPPPVPHPGTDALFLDYDGTLVGIAPTPDAAVADDGLRSLLEALDRRWAGALALVSGRAVADLDGFLAPLRLTIAGLHGLEVRLRDGRELALGDAGAALQAARAELRSLEARIPGTLMEDKRLTVAFHFRGAPAAAAEVGAVAARLAEASGGALRLLHGKMVVELLPAGRDKGRAILDLLGTEPFAGRRPVFVGDDITDEAGFSATNERGGISVRVGTGERGTAARWRLDDVGATRRWLRGCLEGREGKSV
jgi:trehalose 6-phosphate phosphatase